MALLPGVPIRNQNVLEETGGESWKGSPLGEPLPV